MPAKLRTITTSGELGLQPGDLPKLDDELRKLSREDVLLRTVAILHALNAERQEGGRTIDQSFLALALEISKGP